MKNKSFMEEAIFYDESSPQRAFPFDLQMFATDVTIVNGKRVLTLSNLPRQLNTQKTLTDAQGNVYGTVECIFVRREGAPQWEFKLILRDNISLDRININVPDEGIYTLFNVEGNIPAVEVYNLPPEVSFNYHYGEKYFYNLSSSPVTFTVGDSVGTSENPVRIDGTIYMSAGTGSNMFIQTEYGMVQLESSWCNLGQDGKLSMAGGRGISTCYVDGTITRYHGGNSGYENYLYGTRNGQTICFLNFTTDCQVEMSENGDIVHCGQYYLAEGVWNNFSGFITNGGENCLVNGIMATATGVTLDGATFKGVNAYFAGISQGQYNWRNINGTGTISGLKNARLTGENGLSLCVVSGGSLNVAGTQLTLAGGTFSDITGSIAVDAQRSGVAIAEQATFILGAKGNYAQSNGDAQFTLRQGSMELRSGNYTANIYDSNENKTAFQNVVGKFTLSANGNIANLNDGDSFTLVKNSDSGNQEYTCSVSGHILSITQNSITKKDIWQGKDTLATKNIAAYYNGLDMVASYRPQGNTITLMADAGDIVVSGTNKGRWQNGTLFLLSDLAPYNIQLEDVNNITVIGNGSVNIKGNAKANTILAGAKGGTIYGYGGKDNISGGTGVDTIYGGADADTVKGGAGNDKIYGEAGNDNLYGGKGNDTLYGGADNDIFYYAQGDGNDTIGDFAAGKDKIRYTSGSLNKVQIAGGDVLLYNGTGYQKLSGKAVKGQYADIVGTNGKSVRHNFGKNAVANNWNYVAGQGYHGSSKVDTLTITGAKPYTINLGTASLYTSIDKVNAAKATAVMTITGTAGANTLIGGSKNDILKGGAGNDNLQGGNGADKLYAQKGNNTLLGGAGNDYLEGGSGTDILRGGAHNDTIKCGTGVDKIQFYKGDGKDTIQNGAKNDILYLYNITNIKTQAKFKLSGKKLVMSFTTNKNDSITLNNWTTNGLNKFVVGNKTYSLKLSGGKVSVK